MRRYAMDYNHKEIEKKWQNYWDEKQSFKAVTGDNKEPYYILVEFPYPSGAGLISSIHRFIIFFILFLQIKNLNI